MIHLTAGQSISLTTGKITNDHNCKLTSEGCKIMHKKSIRTLRHEIVLRENDLLAFHRMILSDEMIPSVDDLEIPGSIFHSENQG